MLLTTKNMRTQVLMAKDAFIRLHAHAQMCGGFIQLSGNDRD